MRVCIKINQMKYLILGVLLLITLSIGCVSQEPQDSITNKDTVDIQEEKEEIYEPTTEVKAQDIYERSKYSVLYINNTCSSHVKYPSFTINYNYDNYYYDDYLELTLTELTTYEEFESSTEYSGTGFIVDGNLITNSHVVSCEVWEEQLLFDEYLSYLIDSQNYYLTAESLEGIIAFDIKQETDEVFSRIKNENYETEWTEVDVEDYIVQLITNHLYNNLEITDSKNQVLEAYNSKYGFNKKFGLKLIKKGEPFPFEDYAIFGLEGEEFNSLTLGDSGKLSVGEEIFVMGYPDVATLDYTTLSNPTLTKGIISSKKISEENVEYIQIDATSSSGSSGGPVFNKFGEVVGILTAGDVYTDINFMLPSEYLVDYQDKG